MSLKEILQLLDCEIYDGKIRIEDNNNCSQSYSNTSLLHSDEGFCKVVYINTPTPLNIFLYYDLLSLIFDYKNNPKSKFNHSVIVLCTIDSLHTFVNGYINNLSVQQSIIFYYPMPKAFSFNAIYFFLSLNSSDNFKIREVNNEFTIIRNETYLYTFYKEDFNFSKMKKSLRFNKRSNPLFNLYMNRIAEDNFLIF